MSSKYLFLVLLILASSSWSQSYGRSDDAAIDGDGFTLPASASHTQNQNSMLANNCCSLNGANGDSSSSGVSSRFASAGVSPQNGSLVRSNPLKSQNNSFNNSTNNSHLNNSRSSSSFNNSVTTSPALNANLFEFQQNNVTISDRAAQAAEKEINTLVNNFDRIKRATDRTIRNLLFNRCDHVDYFLKAVKPVDAAQSPMNYYDSAKEYFENTKSSFRVTKDVNEVIDHCAELVKTSTILNAKGRLPDNITYPSERYAFLSEEMG